MKLSLFLIIFILTNLLSTFSLAKNDPLPFDPKPESDLLLEILVAGSQTSEVSSVFGHLGLRLKYVSTDGIERDFALSFVANTEDDSGIKRDIKGLTGLYNMNLLIETLDKYVKRTTQIENRSINRFILNSDNTTKNHLFKKLNQFKNEGMKLGNYSFLSKNCATTLYKFFSDMGYFINQNFDVLISPPPISYSRAVFSPVLLGLIQLPKIDSLGSRIAFLENKYGLVLNKEKRTDKDTQQLFSSLNVMSNSDLNALLALDLSEVPGLRIHVLSEIRRQKGSLSIDNNGFLGFREFPTLLYKMCNTTECAENQAKELVNIFGKKHLNRVNKYFYQELHRSRRLSFFKQLENTNQYSHAILLSNALNNLIQ
jgi:hypothetical protein